MEPCNNNLGKLNSDLENNTRIVSREEMATANNPGDSLMAIALNLKAGMDHLLFTLDNIKGDIKDEMLLTLTNQFSNHIDHLRQVIISEINRIQYITTRYSSNNFTGPPGMTITKSTLTIVGTTGSPSSQSTLTTELSKRSSLSVINETMNESLVEDEETLQIQTTEDDDDADDDEDEFLSKDNEISELRIFKETSEPSTSTHTMKRPKTRRYR